ncbi:MAG: iron-containing alcohol dehydrogenase [Burkholderiaceae bacterium]|nr:iron-containing alcohol dehydrogenase [Burkholderiaceae bacterium]
MALIPLVNRLQFDFGAIALLGSELELLGITRPLIVTDKGVVGAGISDRVRAHIPDGLAVAFYDGTPANPTEAAVREATALFRQHDCNGLIAIGGGSPMDLAKGVALAATHDATSLFEFSAVQGGLAKISNRCAPVVAIPTTAGTGSEVSRGGVIIMDNGAKLAIGSPFLIPRAAICDPELTLGLPAAVTAGTGMDAIAHCIEAYCVDMASPPVDAIALDGLTRAWNHLERAVRDGGDRQARWEMMMAASEGALGFNKGLGAVHALSHPTGALKGLHHGTLNAVYLPEVVRFNAPVLGERLGGLGRAMGLPAGEHNADGIAQAIRELNARIGIPAGLGAMGVSEADASGIAEAATRDHTHFQNPRRATADEYRQIVLASL